ncbi:MAG: MFS transporter, partial [Chloroflexota bacterium]
LFEVPTGVVADVYSRRLSIIIGMFLIGTGFLVEGSFPNFWMILLAQALWGVGYTFTSGATQAWISDEIGEAAAGQAFLRSSQLGKLGGLAGIGFGMLVGQVRVSLPIQVGGALVCLVGVFLILFMPDHGFAPAPREQRSSWGQMWHTFQDGLKTVRRRPALLTILWIGLFFGLYSEGFDRLWTRHLLDQFGGQLAAWFEPVTWMGLLRAVGMLLSIGAAELARRTIPSDDHAGIARALLAASALLIAGLLGFALAGSLALALAGYWLAVVARSVIGPVYYAWVNRRLDSSVRATVLSMSSQVDAIGQIAGGPAVGLIGSRASVRLALVSSALILSPVLPLFRRSLAQGGEPALPGPAADQPPVDDPPG